MINRYRYRRIIKNDNEIYSDAFRKKRLKFINQYSTVRFLYPTPDQYSDLTIIDHVWSEGDRFFKLAEEYYGDPKDWWVIAKFNLKPTESHVQLGDIIQIPLPLNKVVEYMKG